jgi:lysophospholipid acyltransferase (LPLAT)-like uncharacterized protein
MLERFKSIWKKVFIKLKIFLMLFFGKGLLHLLIKTCRIQFEGLEYFCQLATREKCMLMLWHNRLIITPYILSHYTPQILYAALVSEHRDGKILSSIIHSYPNGNTIQVSPKARYKALREIIRHVEKEKQIVIITPDGPRGPLYKIKPGIAIAALETQSYVFALNWEAEKFWQIKTWDRQRLPKPFTTIRVVFAPPIRFDSAQPISLDEARQILKKALPES